MLNKTQLKLRSQDAWLLWIPARLIFNLDWIDPYNNTETIQKLHEDENQQAEKEPAKDRESYEQKEGELITIKDQLEKTYEQHQTPANLEAYLESLEAVIDYLMLNLDNIGEFYSQEDKLVVMQEIIPNMQLELKEKKEILLMMQVRRAIFSEDNNTIPPKPPTEEWHSPLED